METLRRIIIATHISIALVFLAACADLKAIRQFADISADSAGYTSLSVDYIRSIERQKNFQEQKFHEELNKQIQIRKEQQKAILGLHRGMQAYMTALGALASDELISYDKSLDTLAGAIKNAKLPSFDDKQVEAFTAITKVIAKAATDGYRQRELKKLIMESNIDFQLLVGAMMNIVGTDYVASLENERIAADKYYKEILIISEHTPPQQASIQLVKESWQDIQSNISTKKQSCLLYVETLRKIGDGHQLLYDNQNTISSKQVLDSIYTYGKDIEGLFKAINELK